MSKPFTAIWIKVLLWCICGCTAVRAMIPKILLQTGGAFKYTPESENWYLAVEKQSIQKMVNQKRMLTLNHSSKPQVIFNDNIFNFHCQWF